MLPSGSADADASNVTSSGAAPDVGVAVSEAVGGTLSGSVTVIVSVAVPTAPSSSVTVKTTL